ncbi:MAG TPA: class I SAM-dependent methyltransferase [Bryobacteraceae bacterium]
MNCDPIAGCYRWLEYLSFGRALERRRFRYLPNVAHASSALILGGGDGRFLARLARHHAGRKTRIHYIDSSARMLDLARRRAGDNRIHYQLADVRRVPLGHATFDLIVTHFFLDCFNEGDASNLVERVSRAALPDARWLVSEFRPVRWAELLLRGLYFFFQVTTGLKTSRLVDHHGLLARHGFRLEREERSWFGWLASELWVRTPDSA